MNPEGHYDDDDPDVIEHERQRYRTWTEVKAERARREAEPREYLNLPVEQWTTGELEDLALAGQYRSEETRSLAAEVLRLRAQLGYADNGNGKMSIALGAAERRAELAEEQVTALNDEWDSFARLNDSLVERARVAEAELARLKGTEL